MGRPPRRGAHVRDHPRPAAAVGGTGCADRCHHPRRSGPGRRCRRGDGTSGHHRARQRPHRHHHRTAIAPGADGALWFTELVAGKAGRITTTGRITEFPLPSDSELPGGITAGPGGMWLTAAGSIAVERIGSTGRVTRFPLPGPGSGPSGITRGPDGGIRYADQSGRIGRVDAQGRVTAFPVPDGSTKVPFRLASGPDRAVWFTGLIGNSIGRVQALPG
ncbi:Vgb family protein [Streptomyces broussonetiae]